MWFQNRLVCSFISGCLQFATPSLIFGRVEVKKIHITVSDIQNKEYRKILLLELQRLNNFHSIPLHGIFYFHYSLKPKFESVMKNEAPIIKRILKVNHAGEFGAIRIYKSQLFFSHFFFQEISPFLEKTLQDEKRHCQKFLMLMLKRKIQPCKTMFLWACGGYLLGFISVLLGKSGIMICTASVERTVHQHLKQQMFFLEKEDQELFLIIEDIQQDEIQHLVYAESKILKTGLLFFGFEKVCLLLTEAIIWLSTWGGSTKLRKEVSSYCT